MKTVQELNEKKSPIVTIDPALEQYRGKVLFPKKLEIAKEMLKNAKLPPNMNRSNAQHDNI